MRLRKNQCTLIHVAAALEWLNQKQPKRVPLGNRVKELAVELRQGELNTARTITQHINTAETAVEKELISLCHDVLSPGHDRDFRTIGLLVLPGLETLPGLTIRIFHIDGSGSGVYGHEFSGKGASGGLNVIYLLAYKQHMRWLKPSDLTTVNQWEGWREVCIKAVSYQSRVWQDYLENNKGDTPISLVACRFCQKESKPVLMVTLSVQMRPRLQISSKRALSL